MFKTTLISTLIATGFAATHASGQTPAAPAPDWTLTGNVGLFSQYIFRGLNQTNRHPALQGGFDVGHKSGLYLGTWASNISWLRDPPTSPAYSSGGSLEWDFYGGYKGSVGDFGYDVGLLQYYYPGTKATGFIKADTLEAYVAGSWKWFSLKYSQALSDHVFGVRDARGTYYLDFSANVPLGETGLTLGAHYGIQHYRGRDSTLTAPINNDAAFSYDDWKVSLSYDMGKVSKKFDGMTVGVAYTDTNGASCLGYGKTTENCTVSGVASTGVYPKNIAKGTGTVFISKTF